MSSNPTEQQLHAAKMFMRLPRSSDNGTPSQCAMRARYPVKTAQVESCIAKNAAVFPLRSVAFPRPQHEGILTCSHQSHGVELNRSLIEHLGEGVSVGPLASVRDKDVSSAIAKGALIAVSQRLLSGTANAALRLDIPRRQTEDVRGDNSASGTSARGALLALRNVAIQSCKRQEDDARGCPASSGHRLQRKRSRTDTDVDVEILSRGQAEEEWRQWALMAVHGDVLPNEGRPVFEEFPVTLSAADLML